MDRERAVLLQLSVSCDEQAPATVRDALARAYPGDAAIGDAMVIASELISNAIRHSGGQPRDVLDVLLERRHGQLEISVRDPGRSGGTARIATSGEGAFGGLGLKIVSELTTEWGDDRGDGYRVWARLRAAETG